MAEEIDIKEKKAALLAAYTRKKDASVKGNAILDDIASRYRIDRTEADVSVRLLDFETAIAEKLANRIQDVKIAEADQFEVSAEEKAKSESNAFEDDELTKFYKDQLSDIIGDVQSMTRHTMSSQMKRMDQLLTTLEASDIDEKDFLIDQYTRSREFLEGEFKKRSNFMAIASNKMGEVAEQYLDIRSLYSGFVDNNPVAMGLFKMGGDLFSQYRKNRKETKELIERDVNRLTIAEHTELNKEFAFRQEQVRDAEIQDIRESNAEAEGDVVEQKESTSDVAQESFEKVVEPTPIVDSAIPPETVVADFSEGVDERLANKLDAEADMEENIEQAEFGTDLFVRLDNIIELLEDGNASIEKVGKEDGIIDNVVRGSGGGGKIGKLLGKFGKFAGIGGAVAGGAGMFSSISSMFGAGGAEGVVPPPQANVDARPSKFSKVKSGAGKFAKSGVSKLGKFARFAGPAGAVAGAGLAGFELGSFLNDTFDLSTKINDGLDAIGLGGGSDVDELLKTNLIASPAADTIKKISDIETSVAEIKDIKEDASNTAIINTATGKQQQSTPKSGSPVPGPMPLTSARNPDSSIRRLNERFLSFGVA